MPAVGEIIAERYRLEERLGVGAMGSVWRAVHVTLGNTFAIKMIKESAAQNPRSLARFEREAVLAAQLDSAHVVRVTDHGQHEGLPFIVMDHLVGEDLRQRLVARERLGLQETARIVRDVCRALTAAHGIGLVHRDIKPENIFITPGEGGAEERAVVLDFGIAKAGDTIAELAATQTGAIVGTPYYLSPEQARGSKTIGPAADMWSLAVVAYECITGERPFSAASIGPLIASILDGPIPSPSEVLPALAPPLEAWFRRAMTRDPAQRFTSAAELSKAFAAAAAAPPVVAITARESGSQTLVLTDRAHETGGDTVALDELEAAALRRPSLDPAKTQVLPERALTQSMPNVPTWPSEPVLRAASSGRRSPERWLGIAVLIAIVLGVVAAAITYMVVRS